MLSSSVDIPSGLYLKFISLLCISAFAHDRFSSRCVASLTLGESVVSTCCCDLAGVAAALLGSVPPITVSVSPSTVSAPKSERFV